MAAVERSNFGSLGRDAKSNLRNDNDIKIIVQGANSQTGIGKTTLAIQLCRYIDKDWSAEERAFVDVRKYINAHLDMPKGSALLLDEIEAGADSRRAMSQENVDLSQAWATLRARNIATVCTLPSISMLDGRMLELADYWILVKSRGLAQPFQINVNDFAPKRLPQRQPLPGEEHIKFVDLPDDDPDKSYLDEKKDEMIRADDPEYISKKDHEKKMEKARDEGRRELRNEAIEELYETTEMSTTDLSNQEWVGVSQVQVTRILNDV